MAITFARFCEEHGVNRTTPTNERSAVSFVGYDSAKHYGLFDLTDYVVSSVCGIVVWLTPITIDRATLTLRLKRRTLVCLMGRGRSYAVGDGAYRFRRQPEGQTMPARARGVPVIWVDGKWRETQLGTCITREWNCRDITVLDVYDDAE